MTKFVPLLRMWDRVRQDKEEGEVATFFSLLYMGEMLAKWVILSLVGVLQEDTERQRYRLLYRLVRADSLGDWAAALDQVLTGPPSQLVPQVLRKEQSELAERHGAGTWQHEAVSHLRSCLSLLGIQADSIGTTVAARNWFHLLTTLRNKTRGHGAPQAAECGRAIEPLASSLHALGDEFSLFQRPWAYLHRNLSGKYRVSPLTPEKQAFAFLKKRDVDAQVADGVYLWADALYGIDLITSDPDLSDFLLPNGNFRSGTFELLSYMTNQTARKDGKAYRDPAQPYPTSQTHPSPSLDIEGDTFTNLPPRQPGYIHRNQLEAVLQEQLTLQRHPIVTLTGSGGIGKTSLALTAIHDLLNAGEKRFALVLWFSARDIDLLDSGPKPVRPHVLSLRDFAQEYIHLTNGDYGGEGHREPLTGFSDALSGTPDGPALYVFDNFETIISPGDVYHWLDTYVRPPNKVLITTRIREFAGDYPIEVAGMTDTEATSLIEGYSRQLGIFDLITAAYKAELIRESDGHPYVIKILLGEVARLGRLASPERIVADRDELLSSLFERTYAKLTPAGQRVFLLLCNWRSVVLEMAVQAIVLRPGNERMEVSKALAELRQASLVEEIVSPADKEVFLSVPLVASLYGKRKLIASPMKAAIEVDTQYLRAFGAARKEDIRHGAYPRIKRFLGEIAQRIESRQEKIEAFTPIFDFIANRMPNTWLDLARLHREEGKGQDLQKAKEYLRRYLESPSGDVPKGIVWADLAGLCRDTGDTIGELHALTEMSQQPDADLEQISSAANRANNIIRQFKVEGRTDLDMSERAILIRRLAESMEKHMKELSATDCSRLAWLFLHLKDETRAREVAELGSRRDPTNEHCARILQKLP